MSNIFEKERSGKPVVRQDDLVVLRIETVNMKIVRGKSINLNKGNISHKQPPRLRKDDKSKAAYLILHFPPQSFAEETFFQTKPEDFEYPEGQDASDEDGDDENPQHPVNARISNESRLVFVVPNDFDIEYSLASVLEACKKLPLKVAKAADGIYYIFIKNESGGSNSGGSNSGATPVYIGQQFTIRLPDRAQLVIPGTVVVDPVTYFDIERDYLRDYSNMLSNNSLSTISNPSKNANNAAQSGAVVNALRIAATSDSATLRLRQLSGDTNLFSPETIPSELRNMEKLPTSQSMLSPAELEALPELGSVSQNIPENIRLTRVIVKPLPEKPDKTTTSIEMPWRLILSPQSRGRWRHAPYPVHSEKTTHTELWHSRLVTPHTDGTEIEPPYPDEERTTRAIWALSGEGKEAAANGEGTVSMQSVWHPSKNLPGHSNNPFRTTLSNSDRFQIVHLSSNFKREKYIPEPLDTNMMMLSAMGGWLDSRGAWDPQDGYSVEEWVHRATMGRDHYVRVVYRGFLFPFGHRVSLVKVSERKFHNNMEGNPAYLRQRLFIIIREKERTFDSDLFTKATKNAPNEDDRYSFYRKFPFSSVKILTETTPDLDDPTKGNSKITDH